MAPSLLILPHQKGIWAAACSAGSGERLGSNDSSEGSFIRSELMRCDSRKIHFHRRFELLQGWSRSAIRTRARGSSVVLACAGFHVQLSVTLLALIQQQSPKRTGCLVSFIKDAGLRGKVANVSSVGGIFSSYGKHSAEMPQRLMEALIVDGGTRLLKTAAACSGSIALYSSLPPSPVLPLHRSVSFLFKNFPWKKTAPLFPLRSSVLGNRRVAWSAHVQKARVYSSSPGGACRRRWTDGPVALPNAHHTLGTARF